AQLVRDGGAGGGGPFLGGDVVHGSILAAGRRTARASWHPLCMGSPPGQGENGAMAAPSTLAPNKNGGRSGVGEEPGTTAISWSAARRRHAPWALSQT
ncbi:hypothetical protein, partial [Sphingobium sp. ba1]|uniref:hypothetical protein n=1 Tax=Sphingobium sp. ba1 TaxID=1522072 RepID=UPI00307B7DCD